MTGAASAPGPASARRLRAGGLVALGLVLLGLMPAGQEPVPVDLLGR